MFREMQTSSIHLNVQESIVEENGKEIGYLRASLLRAPVDNSNHYLGVEELAAGVRHPHPRGLAGGGEPRGVGVVRGVQQPAALQLDTAFSKLWSFWAQFWRNFNF